MKPGKFWQNDWKKLFQKNIDTMSKKYGDRLTYTKTDNGLSYFINDAKDYEVMVFGDEDFFKKNPVWTRTDGKKAT